MRSHYTALSLHRLLLANGFLAKRKGSTVRVGGYQQLVRDEPLRVDTQTFVDIPKAKPTDFSH